MTRGGGKAFPKPPAGPGSSPRSGTAGPQPSPQARCLACRVHKKGLQQKNVHTLYINSICLAQHARFGLSPALGQASQQPAATGSAPMAIPATGTATLAASCLTWGQHVVGISSARPSALHIKKYQTIYIFFLTFRFPSGAVAMSPRNLAFRSDALRLPRALPSRCSSPCAEFKATCHIFLRFGP